MFLFCVLRTSSSFAFAGPDTWQAARRCLARMSVTAHLTSSMWPKEFQNSVSTHARSFVRLNWHGGGRSKWSSWVVCAPFLRSLFESDLAPALTAQFLLKQNFLFHALMWLLLFSMAPIQIHIRQIVSIVFIITYNNLQKHCCPVWLVCSFPIYDAFSIASLLLCSDCPARCYGRPQCRILCSQLPSGREYE